MWNTTLWQKTIFKFKFVKIINYKNFKIVKVQVFTIVKTLNYDNTKPHAEFGKYKKNVKIQNSENNTVK